MDVDGVTTITTNLNVGSSNDGIVMQDIDFTEVSILVFFLMNTDSKFDGFTL